LLDPLLHEVVDATTAARKTRETEIAGQSPQAPIG
jgi:hypothetical protein